MSARTQPTPVAFHAGTAGSLGTTSLVGIRREQAVASGELASTGGTAFARALLGAGGGLLHKAWKGRAANYALFWYKFEVIQ